VVIASTKGKVVIGVNAKPSELHSFLLDVPRFNASLKITESDPNEFRLTWGRRHEYCFDLSILQEGDLCDLHLRPASDSDSMVISSATASIIEAMSLHGIRIGELRDYTQEKDGSYEEEDSEKVAAYLQQHVLANLDQITRSLDMDPATASLTLHRLIDRRIIGCTRIGTDPARLFYYR